MESTNAKLPKDRRRWLIVAFVLVLVSTVTWWCWPRGDARFVGKWEVKKPGDTVPGIVTFRRSGFATAVPAGQTTTYSFAWRVEGNALVMGNDDAGFVSWLSRSLSKAISRLSNHHVALGAGENWHQIVSVSKDTFTLVSEFDSDPEVYVRLPE